jgi:hypothetical protein
MISKIRQERQDCLRQIDNQGVRLERVSPADASELNVQLRKVVEWLVARSVKTPRGPKGK